MSTHPSAAKSCPFAGRTIDDIWDYGISANPGPLHPNLSRRIEHPISKTEHILLYPQQLPYATITRPRETLADLFRKIPELNISLLSPPLVPQSPESLANLELVHIRKILLLHLQEADEPVCSARDLRGAKLAQVLY